MTSYESHSGKPGLHFYSATDCFDPFLDVSVCERICNMFDASASGTTRGYNSSMKRVLTKSVN